MSFLHIWLQALLVIVLLMTLLWLVSVFIRNVSIVDIFWGTGFIIAAIFYFLVTGDGSFRKIFLLILVSLWGLRLSLYLAWRNLGKGEDFRYRQFRQNYGEHRYWWVSFFQTFLLQGVLMWLISAPLLGAMYFSNSDFPQATDIIGAVFWFIGFMFEAGGDFQLARFKADPANKGKILDTGFWRYTRHPNYFGDASVWFGYGIISAGAGGWIASAGSVLMIFLIIKISGVALLERSLKEQKPGYSEYIRKTSAFIPWFPKK